MHKIILLLLQIAYDSCRTKVLNRLAKQEEMADSFKLLMELQEEESNTGIVRKRDQSLFVSEENYHSLLKAKGFLKNEEHPSEVMKGVG